MKNSKTNNSLIFLTTLGVYLGLVLVGATPVLGHAATTRNFEITDEIEIKDDLDKKPSGLSNSSFVDEIASLLSTLNSYAEEEKFSWNSKFEFSLEDLSFDKNGDAAFIGFGELESPVGELFKHSSLAIGRKLTADKIKASAGERYAAWPETIDLKFSSDGSEIRFDISVGTSGKAGAANLNAALTDHLAKVTRSTEPSPIRVIAEKTKSEVNDVKVILVTRLPRAGLISLLAKDATQR